MVAVQGPLLGVARQDVGVLPPHFPAVGQPCAMIRFQSGAAVEKALQERLDVHGNPLIHRHIRLVQLLPVNVHHHLIGVLPEPLGIVARGGDGQAAAQNQQVVALLDGEMGGAVAVASGAAHKIGGIGGNHVDAAPGGGRGYLERVA